MSLLDLFKTKKDTPVKPKPKSNRKIKSAKDKATKKGEPYFEIVDFEFDPNKAAEGGAFELDWNQIFIDQLRREGFQGQEDYEVVDNYFTNVCRHVVLETFEKDEANNPSGHVHKADLGNGKTEYR